MRRLGVGVVEVLLTVDQQSHAVADGDDLSRVPDLPADVAITLRHLLLPLRFTAFIAEFDDIGRDESDVVVHRLYRRRAVSGAESQIEVIGVVLVWFEELEVKLSGVVGPAFALHGNKCGRLRGVAQKHGASVHSCGLPPSRLEIPAHGRLAFEIVLEQDRAKRTLGDHWRGNARCRPSTESRQFIGRTRAPGRLRPGPDRRANIEDAHQDHPKDTQPKEAEYHY